MGRICEFEYSVAKNNGFIAFLDVSQQQPDLIVAVNHPFCDALCKQQFEQSPEAFVSQTGASNRQHHDKVDATTPSQTASLVPGKIVLPIVAGVLYPFFGFLLSPGIAAAAMALSSISEVSNALRLKRAKL